jgi:hypothetical protein
MLPGILQMVEDASASVDHERAVFSQARSVGWNRSSFDLKFNASTAMTSRPSEGEGL